MKSTPLIINWHDQNAPIYSAHFEPHGKGRLATAGGDNNVRLWKVESDGESRKAEYLSTLAKHTQAVNVVRWSPKGELLASAGDDGNVILWVPSETHHPTFGNDGIEDKESWRTKHMCRSSGAEIYDLAWSPDGSHFIIGSMDNITRIYNAASGALVRQIAEHSHYVQGVAWDPLNEYIATQSSDRSVHIYSLKTKDGQYTLNGFDDKTPKLASHIKADLPPRRMASQSPAPIDLNYRSQLAVLDGGGSSSGPTAAAAGATSSPAPSAPGTPTSFALPRNPPSVVSHSRRSSFSLRRSVSPAPSMPLPAVMPMEASPKPPTSNSFGMKNASLYANETLTSFFRRLTFTPDGSLLLTPAGQYQTQHQNEGAKPSYEVVNTVYIYSRGGINKAPIAHLPGHKKPSVAVRCSPIIYTLRQSAPTTKHITIDTSSAEEPIPSLPEPLTKPATPAPLSVMDPPPPPLSASASVSASVSASAADPATPSAKSAGSEAATPSAATPGPKSAFALPHRMIYALATQDSVLLYDTQQQTPICIVSNLHCATFTDLTWSSDGLTLLISSSDGFCSTLSFAPGELGQQFTGEVPGVSQKRSAAAATATVAAVAPTSAATPSSETPTPAAAAATAAAAAAAAVAATSASSASTSTTPAPTSVFAPPSPFHHQHRSSASSLTAPSPPPTAHFAGIRPSSPARSNSTSSIMTQASTAASAVAGGGAASATAASTPSVINNPTLIVGSVPGITATSSGKLGAGLAAAATPPGTPRHRASSVASSIAGSVASSIAGSVAGSVAAAATPTPAAAVAVSVPSLAGTKREAADGDSDATVDGEPPKKRRIAPTPVKSSESG